jgi:hypothetical protein
MCCPRTGERPARLPGTERVPNLTGWTAIIKAMLANRSHWQSQALFDFVQFPGSPASLPTSEDTGAWHSQYGADKNVHGWSGFWSGRSNPEPALNQRAISAVLTAIWPVYMLIPAQFDPA